jgi:hypothetical protein
MSNVQMHGIEDPIVLAAQAAFSVRIKDSKDVSENTKNAQAIAKVWRSAVHKLDPDRFQIEALVTPELDQKIDVVDTETACAYEFKVSGKNAWAEFYKNVVKVIIWNEKRTKKLSSLVFITEEKYGRPFLDAPMPRAYIKYLGNLGLNVSIEYVRYAEAVASGEREQS